MDDSLEAGDLPVDDTNEVVDVERPRIGVGDGAYDIIFDPTASCIAPCGGVPNIGQPLDI